MVSKQEEIREGMWRKVIEWEQTARVRHHLVNELISYLHSQGLRLPNGKALIDETSSRTTS